MHLRKQNGNFFVDGTVVSALHNVIQVVDDDGEKAACDDEGQAEPQLDNEDAPSNLNGSDFSSDDDSSADDDDDDDLHISQARQAYAEKKLNG